MAELTKFKKNGNGEPYKNQKRTRINSILGKVANSETGEYVAYSTEIDWGDITTSISNIDAWHDNGYSNITSLGIIKVIEQLWDIAINHNSGGLISNIYIESPNSPDSNEYISGEDISLIVHVQPKFDNILNRVRFKLVDINQNEINDDQGNIWIDAESKTDITNSESTNESKIQLTLKTKEFNNSSNSNEIYFITASGGAISDTYELILKPSTINATSVKLYEGNNLLEYDESEGYYKLTIVRDISTQNSNIQRTLSAIFYAEETQVNATWNHRIENQNTIPSNSGTILTISRNSANPSQINITTNNNNHSGRALVTIYSSTNNQVQAKLLVTIEQKPESINIDNEITLYEGIGYSKNNIISPVSTTNKNIIFKNSDDTNLTDLNCIINNNNLSIQTNSSTLGTNDVKKDKTIKLIAEGDTNIVNNMSIHIYKPIYYLQMSRQLVQSENYPDINNEININNPIEVDLTDNTNKTINIFVGLKYQNDKIVSRSTYGSNANLIEYVEDFGQSLDGIDFNYEYHDTYTKVSINIDKDCPLDELTGAFCINTSYTTPSISSNQTKQFKLIFNKPSAETYYWYAGQTQPNSLDGLPTVSEYTSPFEYTNTSDARGYVYILLHNSKSISSVIGKVSGGSGTFRIIDDTTIPDYNIWRTAALGSGSTWIITIE